ncbi:ankyrin repeat protein [Ancylostoma duodenale]|uniref:Ankyrin repeat protein n=1 Tax=Ancylostoma duodenale TaxID=51022 RepID=A0A0C2E196_9BILA|nr:ankyrin repeat protein [Ancylostoma duodenale]
MTEMPFFVARVLIQAGAPVNLTSESYESPLTLSCCGGHAELLLIDAGANIEETNDENYTPLMEAAREGHVHVVKILLENGAQVNATTDETMETALTVAACGGFTLSLEKSVSSCVIPSIDFRFTYFQNFDYDGRTALMKAAKNGFTEIVEFLVTKGVDVGFCFVFSIGSAL